MRTNNYVWLPFIIAGLTLALVGLDALCPESSVDIITPCTAENAYAAAPKVTAKKVDYSDVLTEMPELEDYADYHSWSVAVDNYLSSGGSVDVTINTTWQEENHNSERPHVVDTKYEDCWAPSWKRCHSGTYARANHHYSICYEIMSDGTVRVNGKKSSCIDLDRDIFTICVDQTNYNIVYVVYCDKGYDASYDTSEAAVFYTD